MQDISLIPGRYSLYSVERYDFASEFASEFVGEFEDFNDATDAANRLVRSVMLDCHEVGMSKSELWKVFRLYHKECFIITDNAGDEIDGEIDRIFEGANLEERCAEICNGGVTPTS